MIKAKISKKGFLLIKRGGIAYKDQLCCRKIQTETSVVKCGDWCPLFGEPANTTDKRKMVQQTITLCNGSLTGHIIDKRGEVEDEAT